MADTTRTSNQSTELDSDPWRPEFVSIRRIDDETPGVRTFYLEPPAGFASAAGQFNMLYVPGCGEAAISISSSPLDTRQIAHTIRLAGNVTSAIFGLRAGDKIGLRGPYGSSWPVGRYAGWNIVIAAGGIGLAPLRPAIYQIIAQRNMFGRVRLVYGARTPDDLLYQNEFDAWRKAGIEVSVTVDFAGDDWHGSIGVVPTLLEPIPWIGSHTTLWTCGPEIMMRFTCRQAQRQGVAPAHLHLSLERNMNCAVGLCGHCQFGPEFVCKDGPVFALPRISRYLFVEDF